MKALEGFDHLIHEYFQAINISSDNSRKIYE